MNYDYDICFIGGGLNYAGAVVAEKGGLKTLLVEKDLGRLGGTCLHNGCIPSKMFLHYAEAVLRSRTGPFKSEAKLDMEALYIKKEQIVADSTAAIRRQCKGVDLMEDEAALVAPHTIRTSKGEITARYIVIGTGSRPFIPEGIEYDKESVITSDEVLNMRTLPDSITIYGDGAIGLEMASFFASAGVRTELVWRREKLLGTAHPLISEGIASQLERIGVTLVPSRSIVRAAATEKRGVHILFEDGSEHYTKRLLVATGRRADRSFLKCESIKLYKKGIEVDENFETSLPGHYAVGDCNGVLQLAHAARAQVLFVVNRILGRRPESVDLGRVVKFIHTLPMSYAQVGDVTKNRSAVVPLRGWPYARIHDAEEGAVIIYEDREGFVSGAQILAPNAEELISTVATALAAEADASLCRRTILAHPTFSEIVEKGFYRL